jgi:tRNA(fMet)-specific endonuclease VapC
VLILDTDHLSELEVGSAPGMRLLSRLSASRDDSVITAVSVEENLRGWLSEIRSRIRPREQIRAYQRLIHALESHAKWTILPWDEDAAQVFERLVKQRVRIGSQDLKIASITLAHDATLLTRNRKDFIQVPGLRFENWLD